MLKFRSFLLFVFSALLALSIGMKHCDETLDLSSKKNIETVEDFLEEAQVSHLEIRTFKLQNKVETKRVSLPFDAQNPLQRISKKIISRTPFVPHQTVQFLHLFHLF